MKYTILQGALLASSGIKLVSGRSLWSSSPATHASKASDDYLLKTGYVIGNGKLGAIPHGPPGNEKAVLNVDSLWSGGPFMQSNYTGGNPTEEKHSALPDIRSRIFQNGTGDVDALLGLNDGYGSYRTLGNLTVGMEGVGNYAAYKRSLDLKTGVHTTTYEVAGSEFTTSMFCSYPDNVCVYQVSTTGTLPALTVGLENGLVGDQPLNVTCGDGYVRLTGLTQAGPPEGLKYDAIVRLAGRSSANTECSDDSTLKVSASSRQKSVTLVLAAGTDFDQTKGDAESDFSFKGEDPGAYVESTSASAAAKSYRQLLRSHVRDYRALESSFSLELVDAHDSASTETSELISSYTADGDGDPFLEALLFDYSRHMLISSSRPGSLPANLQGVWTEELAPAWSSDYHANINLQMNYWAADQTGLSETQDCLWDYMELNWVPRGSETAELLYGGEGWVAHNEMNIFGHTSMKSDANWANYAVSGAWMMQHVWDNFDYTQDVEWLKRQGYPLIKGVAQYWLSQLQDDAFFEDDTLVVNPCNSPEHGPTTFGCAHYQQEIHRTLDTVLSGAAYVGEDDEDFLDKVSSTLDRLDKGFHITEWGGIKEWKIPDSYGFDVKNDHRHLSHLTGWYPGYSVSSYLGGYTNGTIQSAVRETLESRGNGKALDANAGWPKAWRSAAWARLNNTEQAYYHLRYAVEQNFVGNGLSMYAGKEAPFQIDANFGIGGAVLSMLAVDLPLAHDVGMETRTVVLGPAIPKTWAGGSVKGLRVRGGGTVDFSWDDDGVVDKARFVGSKTKVDLVNVKGKVLASS